ncbi:hypothetical protein THOB06_10374 [Vibrio rotiferianus]|nr:hypothetical protein THOG10_10374 [Vibrio rotiferianus]CAH1557395.1 hypothetical protein THOB06_10374 [Vibrio rotiferianus]
MKEILICSGHVQSEDSQTQGKDHGTAGNQFSREHFAGRRR